MVQVYVAKQEDTATVSSKTNYVVAAMTFFVTAVLVFVSFYQIAPPGVVPSSAPLTEFSSARAMQHLEVIAQKPRPIGSLEHAKARDYLLQQLTAMGLSPEVQKTTAVNQMWANSFPAATVENIIARLKGTGNSKAVMIAGHYDSVAVGPGASDCGAAVAAMLETLRALKEGPPLNNDVIFLFTDGEENGLLGATAFVKDYPGAKDVGVVFNFEARGNGGPTIMFETSTDNGWLIKELAAASTNPVANSLSNEIYKRLPNDTDLTVFKQAGLAGLNFAYIKGVNHYHTPLDNIDSIDERSLQHHGSYALALARHFGNLNLEQTRQSNAVYFNTLGSILVHYPGIWVTPLMCLTLLLLVAALVYGFKSNRLTLSGIALGFFAFLLTMISAALIVMFVWWVINTLHSGYRAISQSEPYNDHLYFVSFAALTVAITSALYIWFRKKISLSDLTVGGLIWWAILMVVTSLLLPGGSYLFTWPLLFSLIAFCFTLSLPDQDRGSMKHSATLSVCAIPGILLFTPMVYLIFLAMTLNMTWAIAVMVVLLLGLLIPHLDLMSSPRRWLLPGVAALVSLAFIAAGSLTSGFNKNAARPDNIFYAMSADSGQAVWASFDQSVDEWTSQFFTSNTERGGLSELIPSTYNGFLKSPAPVMPLGAPTITLLSDSAANDTRALRMRIASARQAGAIFLSIDSNAEVLRASVNGKPIEGRPGGRWMLRYFAAPQEGIELTLEIKASEPLTIRATDMSYGLPEIPGFTPGPRPDHLMPSPFPYSDSTLVTKTYTF